MLKKIIIFTLALTCAPYTQGMELPLAPKELSIEEVIREVDADFSGYLKESSKTVSDAWDIAGAIKNRYKDETELNRISKRYGNYRNRIAEEREKSGWWNSIGSKKLFFGGIVLFGASLYLSVWDMSFIKKAAEHIQPITTFPAAKLLKSLTLCLGACGLAATIKTFGRRYEQLERSYYKAELLSITAISVCQLYQKK